MTPRPDPCAATRPQTPSDGARGACPLHVLSLGELGPASSRLHPPPAYRLSLDSGIGYKNVRRALEQPFAVRLDTWQKLLQSLGLWAVAVPRGPLAPPAPNVSAPAAEPVRPEAVAVTAAGLRALREARGWSRREMARRAGVCLEALASVENGRGLVGSLVRVCAAIELELVLALPPGYDSLDALWRERAGRCLAAPAHYPPGRAQPTPIRSAPASHRQRQPPATGIG
jgi:DNA-binding XRE family transcriptional regulator